MHVTFEMSGCCACRPLASVTFSKAIRFHKASSAETDSEMMFGGLILQGKHHFILALSSTLQAAFDPVPDCCRRHPFFHLEHRSAQLESWNRGDTERRNR